jgi:hypothetical protein
MIHDNVVGIRRRMTPVSPEFGGGLDPGLSLVKCIVSARIKPLRMGTS